MGLEGKVALVTGAQQGIGREAAVSLARSGADVAINYLDDRAAADGVAAEVAGHGRRAIVLQGDVSSVAQGARMVDDTVRLLGGIDILVNNAAVFPRHSFLEMQEADWDFVLDVNLKGTNFMAQAAAKAMIAAGHGGSIINLASIVVRGAPRGVHYAASKGGVVVLTRSIALDLAPYGIRVNAIAPGLTDTAQPRIGTTEEEVQAMATRVPLGRMGTPQEMGRIIAFLASDDASYVNGQILHVNGGSYMP